MYTRAYKLPGHSFFLFGPRGTGKTTWLKTVLGDAAWYDLLRTHTVLELMRQPELFRKQVEALPSGKWVVIDEVQRLPAILNEVHAIMADLKGRHRFALSGSSARKLKRLDTNLLAGRAINRHFFPLTGAELGYDFEVDHVLRFGVLPKVQAEPEYALDSLEAYVANYISQEIQQEALVKSLESFTRFLEVAALMNGQVVNVSGLARDAAVARPTVQRYFDTLVDTLIGVWLPAWRRRAKVKEVAHPKFYFFDPGVVRALGNRSREPLEPSERGFLLETLVLHELRAWMSIHNTGGKLCYWRTPAGRELDFVWQRGGKAVGIEIKASTEWRPEYSAVLKELLETHVVTSGYGVYLGAQPLRDGPVDVAPLKDFMKLLSTGGAFT
ncbi:MAG: ATP-binding protein [Planctomycetes bacterium]|nr:ATP-binding protein [Planctomycetota bacterium]